MASPAAKATAASSPQAGAKRKRSPGILPARAERSAAALPLRPDFNDTTGTTSPIIDAIGRALLPGRIACLTSTADKGLGA
jgi:hypothetical protein